MGLFDNKDKDIISPVKFVKDGENFKYSPIGFMENDINGVTRFAITKLTENGKWMRGELLFYSLNGVEIYTDPKNVIFVDTANNTVFIREYEKVINQITPDNPESKEYILLYTDLGYDENEESSEEFPLRWEAVTGRRQAYDNIKINAPVIDIDRSLVLVESVALKDSLTVRQFMEYLKNSDIINEESFDINDYTGEGFK
jgi:hypothetical protein